MKNKYLAYLFLIMVTITTNSYSQNFANKVYNLEDWYFAKKSPTMWSKVKVPHSCNYLDGHSSSYYRGKSYYKKNINITKEQLDKPIFLLFQGAAQASNVIINGDTVNYHRGGYTPFTFKINDCIKEGDNTILVECDNTEDVQLIPVSSDFNKNNGLHNPVYMLEMNPVYLSPLKYGMYRMHVSTPLVNNSKASTKVETSIINSSKERKTMNVTVRLDDATGKRCYTDTKRVVLGAGDTLNYEKLFIIKEPHLWNGIDDPYLYKATIEIADNNKNIIDSANTKIGYRYYKMDPEKGFFLNGKSYPLRGVAMHQDCYKVASALPKEQFDIDYNIVKELGTNFLRLAHYPHNDYAFGKCDELGIIVQTEIPWVNVCGVNAKKEYFDNMHQQMKEMVVNLYNHPSIMFWGMWNEVDQWGNNDQYQGKFDAARAVAETAILYKYAKGLDPYRYVGMTDDSNFMRKGYTSLKGDYFSENRYNGWYYGKKEDFTKDMTSNHNKMGIVNVAEYGLGINPFCHSDNPEQTTNKGMGGARHDEEYGNLFHESYVNQIIKMPFLNFTSIWVMFDFPVANRQEGYMDTEDGNLFFENEDRKFMNDKGLVTRDRKVKKDVFYLYKALWNKKEPTVYITSRRFIKRAADKPINIKVYSNANSLSLYQNGIKVQTLESCNDNSGVIWTFKPVYMQNEKDLFKVSDDKGHEDFVTLMKQ